MAALAEMEGLPRSAYVVQCMYVTDVYMLTQSLAPVHYHSCAMSEHLGSVLSLACAWRV